MNKQEKAAKEVEVAGWLKSKGYDRRTWQAMAKVIVEYLSEQQVKNCDLADVGDMLFWDEAIKFSRWLDRKGLTTTFISASKVLTFRTKLVNDIDLPFHQALEMFRSENN